MHYIVKAILWPNEDKYVARFCRQAAAVVTGMFFKKITKWPIIQQLLELEKK
jgi:hypothetical protein